MSSFIIYLVEVSLALVLFYLLYAGSLRRETFFKVNRIYLLVSVLVAMLLPLMNFQFASGEPKNMAVSAVIDVITISATGYEQSLREQMAQWPWLIIVYSIGFLVRLVISMVQGFSLFMLIRKALPGNVSGVKVAFVQSNVVPFSFFKQIYLNPNLYSQDQLNKIVKHEQVHVRQLHSFDCLFYEFLIVLLWFNPIVYKYRSAAKENHEFLADSGALRSGIPVSGYQELLFEQSTGLKFYQISNSFNYSHLKQRLVMLTKIKSKKNSLVKLGYFLPLVLIAVLVFACNEQPNTVEEKTGSALISIDDEEVFFEVEKMPEYPGGSKELRMFIAKNVKYPEKAKELGLEAKVFTQFIVDETGKIINVEAIKLFVPLYGEDGELIEYSAEFDRTNKPFELFEQEAVRVVSMQPTWVPGEQDGKKVKVQFTVPINFKLN